MLDLARTTIQSAQQLWQVGKIYSHKELISSEEKSPVHKLVCQPQQQKVKISCMSIQNHHLPHHKLQQHFPQASRYQSQAFHNNDNGHLMRLTSHSP